MKVVTEENSIRELLLKFKFNMVNRMRPEGEITTLDQRDIDNILWDQRLGSLGPVVEANEEGTVVKVTYPNNVCTLYSILQLNESYEFNLRHEGKFVAEVIDVSSRDGFKVEQEDGTVVEVLSASEIIGVEDLFGNKLINQRVAVSETVSNG